MVREQPYSSIKRRYRRLVLDKHALKSPVPLSTSTFCKSEMGVIGGGKRVQNWEYICISEYYLYDLNVLIGRKKERNK